MDLDSFSESYVELLHSLETDNRRIIVSCLLPRQSVDLKPYNEILKAICEENDIQYIDHYSLRGNAKIILTQRQIAPQGSWYTKTNL